MLFLYKIFILMLNLALLSSCSLYEDSQFSASKDSQKTIQSMKENCDKQEKNRSEAGKRIAKERRRKMIEKKKRAIEESWCSLKSYSHVDNKNLPEILFKNVSFKSEPGKNMLDSLSALSSSIGVDIFIDPSVDLHKCNIIGFTWNKKGFIHLVDTICNIFDLVYRFNCGILHITSGSKMYLQIYDIPFLNVNRNTENVTVSSDSFPSNSADNKLNVSIKNDFWDGFKNGIDAIIKSSCDSYYSINEQNGVLNVYTSAKCHKLIHQYIQKIKSISNKQVSIEAKIIEVKLKNEYSKGISWGKVFSNTLGIAFNNALGTSGLFFGQASRDTSLDNFVKALEVFGSLRTISNPRITAMNNQPSLLKIAKNHVYFTLQYNASRMSFAQAKNNMEDESRELLFTTSIPHAIPIGITLFILPSIDENNNKVTMFIRPTVSSAAKYIDDPATQIAFGAVKHCADLCTKKLILPNNQIPITDTKEVSSVIQVEDGGVAVLGGFIESKAKKNARGIPILNKIPVVSDAITNNELSDDIYELVILIRVNILNNDDE